MQSWQGSYFIAISSTLDHSAWISSSALSSLNRIRWISMQINSRAKAWGSDMSAKQKIRLYNSCVVSVLLDAAKTWGITQADKKRFDAFDSRCLGGISNVKWHHYVRNIEFQERTRKEKIVDFLTRTSMVPPLREHAVRLEGRGRSWWAGFAPPGFPAQPETHQRLGKTVEISCRFWLVSWGWKSLRARAILLLQGVGWGQYSLTQWEKWGGKEVNEKRKIKDISLQNCSSAGIFIWIKAFQTRPPGFCNENLNHADTMGFNRLCRAKIYSSRLSRLRWTPTDVRAEKSPVVHIFSQKQPFCMWLKSISQLHTAKKKT